MASFPEPVEYKIVRNVQSVRTYVTNTPMTMTMPPASFFFGVRIWLVKVLGRFSINYFRGLGLRIRVRVRVCVRVRFRVCVRVRVRVGVRVSVVIWSG